MRRLAAGAIFLVPLLGAALLAAETDLLPARVAEFAKAVEKVRGHRFDRAIPATEIGPAELKRVLKTKLAESFAASPEDTRRTLVAIGLIDDAPDLSDRLVDFYASQVVAFYDPEPRRFFVVRGAQATLEAEEFQGTAEKLIYSHELTHALQDQELDLDRKMKSLKEDGDQALALQSLLEGEATLVMVRVALAEIPGADAAVEEMLTPLLSAGALEKANIPKGVPDYFVEQLFFPYVEGTAYVRRAVQKGGWAAVDRLWKSPPVSSSQILHEGAPPPEADLAGTRTPVPSGARSLYADTLGEWGIRFLLRRAISQADADAAAAGWRGDRITYFAENDRGGRDPIPGDRIGYVWRIRYESVGAAERFESALRRAREMRPAATVEQLSREGRDVVVTAGLPERKP